MPVSPVPGTIQHSILPPEAGNPSVFCPLSNPEIPCYWLSHLMHLLNYFIHMLNAQSFSATFTQFRRRVKRCSRTLLCLYLILPLRERSPCEQISANPPADTGRILLAVSPRSPPPSRGTISSVRRRRLLSDVHCSVFNAPGGSQKSTSRFPGERRDSGRSPTHSLWDAAPS